MDNARLVSITTSHNPNKKYDALFRSKDCPCKNSQEPKCGRKEKIVSFGSKGMSDFTKHKDPERKERYIERHKKSENWDNPFTPGSLSRYLLWNKETLKASIEDYKKRFNL
jgi:hypothetical protein